MVVVFCEKQKFHEAAKHPKYKLKLGLGKMYSYVLPGASTSTQGESTMVILKVEQQRPSSGSSWNKED